MRFASSLLVIAFCLACEGSPPAAPLTDGGAALDATAPAPDAGRPPPFVGPSGPSAGCGAAGPTGTLDRTATIAGVERRYRVVVPEGGDSPRAIVFAFHGLGDNLENFARGLALESVASDAIVVYPHGVHMTLGANGWDLGADGVDVALFDHVLAELEGELCVDRGRVFATGFSYGAFFAHSLGCHRGDVVLAIAAVAGGQTSRTGCRGQVAAWMIHGEADTTVAYSGFGLRARDFWVADNGCDPESPASEDGCTDYRGCDEGYPVVFCSHSGAHSFPPSARAALWRFFDELDEGE